MVVVQTTFLARNIELLKVKYKNKHQSVASEIRPWNSLCNKVCLLVDIQPKTSHNFLSHFLLRKFQILNCYKDSKCWLIYSGDNDNNYFPYETHKQ